MIWIFNFILKNLKTLSYSMKNRLIKEPLKTYLSIVTERNKNAKILNMFLYFN